MLQNYYCMGGWIRPGPTVLFYDGLPVARKWIVARNWIGRIRNRGEGNKGKTGWG